MRTTRRSTATISRARRPIVGRPIGRAGIDCARLQRVGIQAIEGANDGDNTLVLGGDDAGVQRLPERPDPRPLLRRCGRADRTATSSRRISPWCPARRTSSPSRTFDTTVQFLVFNEFEQRFSASRKLNCFQEFELCSPRSTCRPCAASKTSIPPRTAASVRSSAPSSSGTLTGQTRIRGVECRIDTEHGHGILGVAEEFYRTEPTPGERTFQRRVQHRQSASVRRRTSSNLRPRDRGNSKRSSRPGGNPSRLFFCLASHSIVRRRTVAASAGTVTLQW